MLYDQSRCQGGRVLDGSDRANLDFFDVPKNCARRKRMVSNGKRDDDSAVSANGLDQGRRQWPAESH